MKIKKYVIAFLLLGVFFNVDAAYLKNVPQKLTQPNGTIIHCFASGDEYHNWLHDSLGYTIIQHPQTGYYVYALQAGDGVVASTYIVGVSNPVALNLTPEVNISPEKWMEKRASIESMTPTMRTHKSGATNHGHINNLVFFIRFSDEASFTTNTYTQLVQKHNDSSSVTANSMYNFYKLSSYGNFTVSTTFYPSSSSNIIYSYQDTNPRDYYLAYDATTNPIGYSGSVERMNREHGLLERVVNFFEDSIPWGLDLDFNNDGCVDNVCFITSGGPEGWSGLMWPHRWALYSRYVSIQGLRVFDYNFIMESYTDVGVLTHEFMHTLGAPDLYRYDKGDNVTPVGNWDLMASTNYSKPQGMSAYMKYKYGNWTDSIPELTQPGRYTLYPANGNSPYKTAYKIRTSANPHDYIVLDYRKTNSMTFESPLSGSGITIYRINEEFEGNADFDSVSIFDEVYLFRPNGTILVNGNLSQAAFSQDVNRTNFDAMSNPKPFCTDGTTMNDIIITNISYIGDSMQFTFLRTRDTLLVNNNVLHTEYATSSQASFNITSNTQWEITNIPSWLSLNTNSGQGNASITLTVIQENTGKEDSCVLTLRTNLQTIEHKIVVRRSSYPLLINKNHLDLGGKENDTTSFVINSRVDWNIENDIDWVTLSSSQGNSGVFNITVTATESNTKETRTDTLFLSSDSLNVVYAIIVTQDFYVSIAVNDSILHVDYTVSSQASFDIESNTDWEIVNLPSWLDADKHSGTDNETVILSVTEENTGNADSCILTVRSTVRPVECKIIVYRNGKPLSISDMAQKSTILLYPNPVQNELSISLSDMEISSMEIYSITGQLLYHFSDFNTNEVTKIDVTDLASGMYFVKFHSAKNSISKLFIKE